MASDIASLPFRERLNCNKAELAEAFGVSVAGVDHWIRKQCPYVQRGSKGVPWIFNVLDVAEWRYGKITDDENDDPEQMGPKERLDWYRGEKERLALKQQRGELIPASQVEAGWTGYVANTKSRLMALPSRLAPEMVRAKTIREAEKVIKAAVIECLEELSGSHE